MARKKRKPGRPKKKLDEREIARLAKVGASYRLIAQIVGCDESTLRDRFPALVRGKSAEGRVELLEAQHKLAVGGDGRMLVWLGRNRLKQTDQPPEGPAAPPVPGGDELPDLTGVYTVSLQKKAPTVARADDDGA